MLGMLAASAEAEWQQPAGMAWCVAWAQPHGKWRALLLLHAGLNDTAAVYEALIGRNSDYNYDYAPANVALVGDSAGGGLVMALLLLLQQRGLPLPGAAGVYSPLVALDGPTDTYTTLGDFDLVVTSGRSGFPDPVFLAYVSGTADLPPEQLAQLLSNPLVSPIYGDYNTSAIQLPPLLIQVGLRETLLGDSVLLFRRLKAGGQCVFISPWVGMFHDFQFLAWGTPESDAGQREMGQFLGRHLGGGGAQSAAGASAHTRSSAAGCCW